MGAKKRNVKHGVGAGKWWMAGLLALLLMPSLAQALIYDFSSQVTGGPLTGQMMTGWFELDDAVIDGAGNTAVVGSASGLLQLELSFDGQTFTATDDSGHNEAPFYPLAQLSGWDVTFVDYMIAQRPWTLFSNIFTYAVFMDGSVKGEVDYSSSVTYVRRDAPVPEPATMVLFGAGLIGMASYSRRKI